MKTKYLILSFVAILLASCGEIDESNLKLYPSKVYLGVSGFQLKEIYDLGEDQFTWDVFVAKSGYYDNAAEVTLAYDPTVLKEYQDVTQDGLDFVVLPENVGALGKSGLVLDAQSTLVGTQLTFDMAALRTQIPKDEKVKYVYPVRVKSSTADVAATDKDYLLLAIQLHSLTAKLRGKGGISGADCDPYRGINMDKVLVPLTIDLPFDNKDMELTFTYKADPDLLEAYNDANGTSYKLLPECYTTPELKIKAGEVSGTVEIEVDPSGFVPEVGGVDYLLPIRITGCDNEWVKIQEGAVTYLEVGTAPKWSGTWTLKILEGEKGMSTTAGENHSVKLYIRQAALRGNIGNGDAQKAMKEFITDNEAILCPGWAGTMYEQCSPVIKVTDEDAGNGRKKVEVLAGWLPEVLQGKYFHDKDSENCWYDPSARTIHLEYSGIWSWDDSYTFKREYTQSLVD